MYPLLTAILGLTIFSTASLASSPERAEQIVNERCHLCHGKNGEASSAIYPRLAGQNADYIVKQLTDFQLGQRKGTMNEMAKDLTKDEMVALGFYFAAKPPKSHRVRDQEFAAVGAYLYKNGNSFSGIPACQSCHGANGYGTATLPRLAGQHKRYVVEQLQAFYNGARTNDHAIMHSIASKLTEFEMQALAQYISGIE
ncbi:MAG: cytochrome c4 [Gammaproteobacteria bacterium]|nr:cytochrome c4 [Gammaproteobacteria bacterium]